MSMEINGMNIRIQTDYTERLKEKQPSDSAGKAKTAEEGRNDVKGLGGAPEPQDAYVSSQKLGGKPSGLYRIGQGANGRQAREKADASDKGGDVGPSNAKADGAKKSEEKCVGNTDRVDREIRKLKEKKQQLMQQIRTTSGEEEKVRVLEKKLAQVESELSRKDNESYRRQHTVFSSWDYFV